MYNKIWLMVPTYKRVEWIKRFMESAVLKSDSPLNIAFCICVNKKDKMTLDFIQMLKSEMKTNILFVEESTIQPNLALYFNMMYDAVVEAEGGEDCIVSMLGDDMVFETKGYDTHLLDEINKHEGIGVFWCDDGYIAHEKCCVNLFVTKKFVDATGKPFMCPFYKADMIDAIWWMIGRQTQTCHYLDDVVIKHFHNSAFKSFDETFQRLRPLQISANAPDMQQVGKAYAALVSGNLISAGYGSWNTL
jgi:hypothetical protein